MTTAQDVAQYFLSLVNEDEGDLMSNHKLQKLLYYAQGFHLAVFDKPLFSDNIEAWTYGPVVPSVYHAYKHLGSQAIPRPDHIDLTTFDEETIGLLDEVFSVYGQYSAFALRDLTHIEPPWRDTVSGGIISHDAMKDYFKTQVQ
jgi:uncharacterized phage-associated protein